MFTNLGALTLDADDISDLVAQIVSGFRACVDTVVEDLLGGEVTDRAREFLYAIDAVDYAATIFDGIIDTQDNVAELLINISARRPDRRIVLAGSGLGVVPFGSFVRGGRDQEIEILLNELGPPDHDTGWGEVCPTPDSSEYRWIRWGPLTTEWWSTEDGSYLQAWHYSSTPQAVPGGAPTDLGDDSLA